ncbi:MAG: nicotinate-nucleotide--dimethylbenzimidazole phosphoribosyltransferase [Planctomycetota bacterium]|jgi:nicotinate-nucleotide--dimethylbenzimidazole phosphoribosyltransferase|nr:nicotinate-nucleotide--dimethylbenzimidazole phosphoribosyltransferase [Planctomycetota bacterium]
MSFFSQVLAPIQGVDVSLEPQIRDHLDNLTKPRGSLGQLEEIAVRYCLARGSVRPDLGRKVIYTFAADHGVAAEGVSAFPAQVTVQMVRNMLAGGAGVNVLARHAGAEVRVVDIGVNDPLENAAGLIRRKIALGTANITKGPAMTPEQCLGAIEVGMELAAQAATEGVTLIGTGEMGIGNTTPSAALFAALLPCEVEAVTGLGTGIDIDCLAHKQAVIRQALEINKERLSNPLGALAAVGSFEIAGICGLILGAAARRIPVVVDGFISTAGALAAWKLCPTVRDYLFFSHVSAETGHRVFFDRMGVRPLLDLGMCLGEGTGAALGMSLIEAAVKVYREMATFDSGGVARKSSLR